MRSKPSFRCRPWSPKPLRAYLADHADKPADPN